MRTAGPRFPPIDRRLALVLGLTVLSVIAGYVGQGHGRVGVRASPTAVSATAVATIGGAGTRQPVHVLVTVAVVNQGRAAIRVVGVGAGRAGVTPVSLAPHELSVAGGGSVGQVSITLDVDCRLPRPLLMPSLRIARSDAVRDTVPVAGAGLLLEACGRASPLSRTLDVSAVRVDGTQLVVDVVSPTSRPTTITAVRAGGVPLRTDRTPVQLVHAATLRLSPPPSCPVAWLIAGLPGEISLDLAAQGSATVDVRLGRPMSDWLLATACSGTAE